MKKTVKNDKDVKLVETLAKLCSYVQEHVSDPEAWDHNDLEHYMTCTSYAVSAFLAQNTKDGKNGVDCNVVLDALSEMPPKTEKEWNAIIGDAVEELGGIK